MKVTHLSNCWTYATNQDDYLSGQAPNNTAYVNKQTNATKTLVYTADSKSCESICAQSRFGSGCYGTYSYDIAFGIPKDSYVCWFEVPCVKYFPKSQYTVQDTAIFHDSKYRCGFLCDTVYGQEGRCKQTTQTAAQKAANIKDEKYYCFYRGPQFAFKTGPFTPAHANVTVVAHTNTTVVSH